MTIERRHGHSRLLLALAVWAALVAGGFVRLAMYQGAPGAAARAPRAIKVRQSGPRLLVFLHPECPCSLATVAELDRLVASTSDRVSVEAYFFAPRSMPRTWSTGALYKNAGTIPGVRVALDPDGAIARSFGVNTSGQVLLYSADGKLVFSGGITASRGHEGDNDGRDAVVAYLTRGICPIKSAPVFGCSLGFVGQAPGGRSEG